MSNFKTIEEVKAFLKEKGYYTDNLWCVDDVQQTYECTDEEAYSVLDAAANSNYITNEIFSWIDRFAEEYGLIMKEE